MPVYPNTPQGRRSREAFDIVDAANVNPLLEAINAAQLIEDASERCHAWIRVAEFVYAKPKQKLEVEGNVTLEQILGRWSIPGADVNSAPVLPGPEMPPGTYEN